MQYAMSRPYIGRVFVMPEIRDRIIDAVRKGAKQGAAAAAGGITREWLNKALARGRKNPESVYGAFAQDYAEAEVAAARDRIARFKAELAKPRA